MKQCKGAPTCRAANTSLTVAEVVSNQPESIKDALDVVAFGAAFKSVSALTNKAECFLIMLVIHSLWSPSMMTAFAKLLINSQDISATGALNLLECVSKNGWSSMAKSEIKLFCPHYWRSCPGPMDLRVIKGGLQKNWKKFEALAASASSLPYLTCRIAFGEVTGELEKLGAGHGQYTSAHYMRDLVIAQGAVVPGRAPLLMSPKLYGKLPEADRLVVPKEYSPCEWACMVCMVGKKRRSTELDEALVAKLVLLSAKFADDGSSVEGGGVQNGSVPSRGGDTAGAPMPTAKKSLKRPARASGSMAPELLPQYQHWHLLIPGKKFVGELQFPYPKNGSFSAYANADKAMDPDAFYTDATSCAMDAFNLGIGQSVLDRQIINSPFDPDKGISYEVMEPAIEAAGFAMRKVFSGSKKKRTNPTMTQILGLVSGVFFVEFFWKNKSGESDFHVIAVNCDQRRVFCNTLGVIPFAAGKKHESAATHAQVVDDLKVVNVYRVYRIVQRV